MKAVQSRLESNGVHVAQECANCGEQTRSRKRDFSEKAWQALMFWNEVGKQAIDRPICDECYNELRDVLIDRSDEIETSVSAPKSRKRGRGRSRLKAG